MVSRAFSVLMAVALAATLAVKFFHSCRYGMTGQYLSWILADVAVLLGIEAILAMGCFLWPRRATVRVATIVATVACVWSMINAGWLIRTGTQVFPQAIMPLVHDPLNVSLILAVNLIKNPIGAILLLVPGAMALSFVGLALARPILPHYRTGRFLGRISATVLLAIVAVPARGAIIRRMPSQPAASELTQNSQIKAIARLVMPNICVGKQDFLKADRTLPTPEQVRVTAGPQDHRTNVVIVVFEGLAYRHTSLADPDQGTTPFLRTLARDGVEFSAMRSVVTHTSKAIFAILTGRYPSASQDAVETIPAPNGYGSLATILARQRGYRTAFFQSAKGSFESRPSLVHNLGLEGFYAREHVNDPNTHLGYLSADEFAMLRPVREWLTADRRPFLLIALCSATHDPYEVPLWFGERAKEPLERYRQTVAYTDAFLAALYGELAGLGLAENTFFCAIGDHGEAFGEHNRLGHDLIGYDEALRVPWVMRGPSPLIPGTRIAQPVSSIDVTPTLLALLGFQTQAEGFDGLNALGPIPSDRKAYFSCWANDGPAGFVSGSLKYLYHGSSDGVTVYDLSADPGEWAPVELVADQARAVAFEVLSWRKSTLFRPDQQPKGKTVVFETWLCKWAGRDATAKYLGLY